LDSPKVKANRYIPVVVVACLILLLAFSTATAFAQDAWAPQSFQIGIFALVAIYLVAGIGRGLITRQQLRNAQVSETARKMVEDALRRAA
jgi:predicted Na+-dependent transporter